LNTLSRIKTVERTVENERIHLYLHLKYVNSPEIPAKKEYQSLVSPIVFIGGRPNVIHNPTMKARRIRDEDAAQHIAPFLLPQKARIDAEAEARIAATAKYMNPSQPIIVQVL
jgi:hypothetical protein